jgi:hypothetical protein
MEKTANKVSELLQISEIRKEAYKKASGLAISPELKRLYEENFLQTMFFDGNLKPYTDYQEQPDIEIHPVAQIWNNLDTALRNQGMTNEKTILSACLAAEKETLKFFESTNKDKNIPIDLAQIISRQIIDIKDTIDKLEKHE